MKLEDFCGKLENEFGVETTVLSHKDGRYLVKFSVDREESEEGIILEKDGKFEMFHLGNKLYIAKNGEFEWDGVLNLDSKKGCVCGNNEGLDGFYPVNDFREKIEPTVESNWKGYFQCERCKKVYVI